MEQFRFGIVSISKRLRLKQVSEMLYYGIIGVPNIVKICIKKLYLNQLSNAVQNGKYSCLPNRCLTESECKLFIKPHHTQPHKHSFRLTTT